MRRSPLTLTLFASLLIALAATTTAFVINDKTVRLDVDGRPVAVHTFAGNVAGVLRKAHLNLGPHDTVAPDVSAPVHDGSRVIVRHGRLLTLQVDGVQRHVWVTAMSVAQALDQLGLDVQGSWLSASRSLSIPRQGLAVSLRLPQQVTVLVDGRRLVRTTTAPDVGTFLGQLGISLGPLDQLNVPPLAYPHTGLVISVARISQRMIRRDVAIPFNTKQVKSSALYVGDSRVERSGKPGLRVLMYRVTWKNHKISHRRLMRNVVTARPVAAIVEVGTKAKPRYTPSADGLNWPALAQCESGGNPREVSSNGQYRGLYQFTMGTWQSVGGSGDPIDASSNEQTYRAQILYRRDGDSPWPVCGHYLYS